MTIVTLSRRVFLIQRNLISDVFRKNINYLSLISEKVLIRWIFQEKSVILYQFLYKTAQFISSKIFYELTK